MSKDKQQNESTKAKDDAEVAKIAADAAASVTEASPPPAPTPEPAKPAPKLAGDIPVTCLKTEPHCMLGNRRYQLIRGQEIMMDPSHADELADGGWVAKVEVVRSDS